VGEGRGGCRFGLWELNSNVGLQEFTRNLQLNQHCIAATE
jgi:hypothetical protein